MRSVVAIGGFLLMTLMVGRAQATLFDRGNGLVFDDFDHLSWTQNAALSGLNDWASQKLFADSLVFAGFGDFILATLSDLEGLYLQLPGPAESNKTGAQGPFTDIQSTYFSRTEIDASRATVFSFLGGDEAPGDKNFLRYGWAVRFGDSQRLCEGAPAPVPTTAVAGNGFPGIEVGTMVAAARTGAGCRHLNSG